MDLVLDGQGPVYGQVARALKSAIASGRLTDGAKLPASRELARDLGVSRTTVVAAFERLRAEGYLSGKVGSGSYIRSPWGAPAATRLPRRSVLPQSAYARRLREVHEPSEFFGARSKTARHAFQFGLPIVSPMLATAWAREVARVAPYVRPNYPAPQGVLALREAISAHISRTRGVLCAPDDVLIVAGTQQAIGLVARVLLEVDDEVILEEPHYFTARQLLQIHGARLVPVPTDEHGLRVDALPSRPVKLVYVTPSHHFPTGAVLSAARRQALLEYARQSQGWILEDDYDGEFRYARQALPSLQSMDRDGRVIYVGGFSKTLFPALRLAYMVMPPGLKRDLLSAKWADDFGNSPLEQTALAQLIVSGVYERHLRLTTTKLAERRQCLVDALRQGCGDRVEILPTHAGMHVMLWLTGLDAAHGERLVDIAREQKLDLYPVAPCYLTAPTRAGLLMGYSAMSAKEIRSAVGVFARCLERVHRELGGRPRLVLAHSA